MPIARITVAGAIAITSQFTDKLTTKLKGFFDYKRFLSKSRNTFKGPKI